MKENTWGAQKAGNSMQILSAPPQASLLSPYQYFEQGESIYMVLYFPILSSGGNPRASPEVSNAPASISLPLILLTRGRSPIRPFPQCATECIYSRCVCVCVRVLCEGLWFYTDT